MTKQQLAYHVMDLPLVQKTFTNVDVVGFYHRSSIQLCSEDGNAIVYYDQTEYSAYAERCRDNTVVYSRKNAKPENELIKEMVAAMNFREFTETIVHEWIPDAVKTATSKTTSTQFRTRDVNSGHWLLKQRTKRRHIRFSTALYTDLPRLYKPVEVDESTTQTSFFSLDYNKRRQLYQTYKKLVCYFHGRKVQKSRSCMKKIASCDTCGTRS